MALGLGRGADLRAPLAIAVIGGLLSATVLTLVVVPVAYDLLDEFRLKIRGVLGWSGSVGQPSSASLGTGGDS
jgi:HAE1 family hydrophobic/amphiphilic exporter-1